MKKIRFVLLLLSLSFATLVHAQQQNEGIVCQFDGSAAPTADIQVANAAPIALNRVSDILNTVGLKKNFSVLAASVDNAGAIIKGSSRYILYNPYFMAKVDNASQTDWSSYSILAHEIGHHLNGHTIQAGGSSYNAELEADEFSGFVLRKLGATLGEAQSAIAMLATNEGSDTHPGRAPRLNAIAAGWNKADQQMRGLAI